MKNTLKLQAAMTDCKFLNHSTLIRNEQQLTETD